MFIFTFFPQSYPQPNGDYFKACISEISAVKSSSFFVDNYIRNPAMKPEIHPKYEAIAVTCSCGNKFETQSTYTKDELHVEVCSQCHPFYTGKQKIMDTAGQVDKFRRRYG